MKQIPVSVLAIVVGHNSICDDGWSPQMITVFSEVANFIATSQYPSIDDVAAHLMARGLVSDRNSGSYAVEARSLVFAMIGWQTMLYRPALGTCPPEQLAVTDEQNGYNGQAFMALKQDHKAAKRPLHEFLLGFGILLPPCDLCISTNADFKKSFEDFSTTEPSSFNAFLLNSIGRFSVKWVDVLSCHLELDERAKTIFLFRYPSFCIASSPTGTEKEPPKTVIHASASPPSSSRLWASEEDVTKVLRETLLSYRLLFGQNNQARKLYKRLDPFAGIPLEGQDNLLSKLCGRKSFRETGIPRDKESYDLRQDFPILRSRLVNLQRELARSKPRSWKELWRDKRDSAGWFTFWAVIIFGAISILLSAIQVLLQILQIALGH